MSESVESIIRATFRKAVTFRRYGQNGELSRPMFHRWPVDKIRGSVPLIEVMAMNVTKDNALFRRLCRSDQP